MRRTAREKDRPRRRRNDAAEGRSARAVNYNTDLEAVQMMAELCAPSAAGEDDISRDALNEVPPGGHFFGAAHTMQRYQTEFYQPLVADLSNFGTRSERGALSASDRAARIWKHIVEGHRAPNTADPGKLDGLRAYVAKRSAMGGAAPVS